jgi:hypothetical protein
MIFLRILRQTSKEKLKANVLFPKLLIILSSAGSSRLKFFPQTRIGSALPTGKTGKRRLKRSMILRQAAYIPRRFGKL